MSDPNAPQTTDERVAWVPWMVNPSRERLAAYAASEVRYRLVGNIAHVALLDEDMAEAVDVLEEASGR